MHLLPNSLTLWLLCALTAGASAQAPAPVLDWQTVGRFELARTETTIAQFERFVQATGFVSQAEREGGGHVYESGWVRKPGWVWSAPFGPSHRPADDEPAVHVTFAEAQAFCRWAGGRLPTDTQWVQAAYTEQRSAPPAPWVRGRTYPWPTGASPEGAQCLDDRGAAARDRAVRHGATLARGIGPRFQPSDGLRRRALG